MRLSKCSKISFLKLKEHFSKLEFTCCPKRFHDMAKIDNEKQDLVGCQKKFSPTRIPKSPESQYQKGFCVTSMFCYQLILESIENPV